LTSLLAIYFSVDVDGSWLAKGGIPFYFLCAYLEDRKHHSARNAFVWAIIVGALTNLGIKLLQVFLPARDSSLLVVVNNLIGATLGAFLQLRIHDYWCEAT